MGCVCDGVGTLTVPVTLKLPDGVASCRHLPATRSASWRSDCATLPPEAGRSAGRLARSDTMSDSRSSEIIELRNCGRSGTAE